MVIWIMLLPRQLGAVFMAKSKIKRKRAPKSRPLIVVCSVHIWRPESAA
jgi:hypothetical protein